MDLDILYQDHHFVSIFKPPGLLVHRTSLDRHDQDSVVDRLKRQMQQTVFPVHRLDKATSGVLILALSSEAAGKLSLEFSLKKVEKTYWAIVRGFIKEEISLHYPLKNKIENRRKNSQDQIAETFFRPLVHAEIPLQIDRYPTSRFSLVEAKPKTGRTHQIRRHLKHLSHPILGDVNYGNGKYNRYFNDCLDVQGLLLWSQKISFTNPYTNQVIRISSKIPEHFLKACLKLGISFASEDL